MYTFQYKIMKYLAHRKAYVLAHLLPQLCMYLQFNSMYICLVLGIGMLYCAIGVGGCVILVYLFVYMYTATVLVGPYVHSSQIDCCVSKQSTSFAPTYNQFWLPSTVSVCTYSYVIHVGTCTYVQS